MKIIGGGGIESTIKIILIQAGHFDDSEKYNMWKYQKSCQELQRMQIHVISYVYNISVNTNRHR